jgi:hypothetical protein
VAIGVFCVIVIASMFLWRDRVNLYQKSIVEGYNRMVKCEHLLHVPYDISIRKNLEALIQKNPLITPKPNNFRELCEVLTPEKYKHQGHEEANFCAKVIGVSAFMVLILWLINWIIIFLKCN